MKLSGLLDEFRWINESRAEYKEGVLKVYALGKTDYFNSPVKVNGRYPDVVASAPFYYMNVTGDFVLRAKVSLEFKSLYDAAALFIYESDRMWAKLAFEKSDMPGRAPAVVSVVTNNISDDCNGPVPDTDSVWFQVARVDDTFAFHYSLDGEKYSMVRLFTLPVRRTIRVGFEAQSPVGEGGYRYFSKVSLENVRLNNIRAGR